jgi:branched-chain amino acid transport system substrate-binding protein
MRVKRIIAMSLSAVSLIFVSGVAWTAGQYGPGAGDTEIKIGNTMAYSGPASSYGVIGKSEAAYFTMINEQGGIKGRKINFISRDDGYSPPKTVEQVRKMVEEDAWHAAQHCHPGLFKRQQGASTVCCHWR